MADERPPSCGPSQSIDVNSGATTAQTTRFGRGAAGEQGDTAAPRALKADAAEFVPGGIAFLAPRAMQAQPPYPYPQMAYPYSTVPSNFMANWPQHGGNSCTQPYLAAAHVPPPPPQMHTRSALVGASVDGTPVGYKPQTNKEALSNATTTNQLLAPAMPLEDVNATKAHVEMTVDTSQSGHPDQGEATNDNRNESNSIICSPIDGQTKPKLSSASPHDSELKDELLGAAAGAANSTHSSEVLDSWEDVSALTTPTTSMHSQSKPAIIRPLSERRIYVKAQLLEIRSSCQGKLPPSELPCFLVEKSSPGELRASRRLGPGGSRGGGAGAGGGGSAGGRHSSVDTSRRDQRHGRHRKADCGAASNKWDRGQRVKQKDTFHEHWGPEPVEPLKTSAHRWNRKDRSCDAMEVSLNKITSILNKMTPENFEKLSTQCCELEMTSSEMLRRVIGVLFDKAVDEPHFAAVYAALCARLAEATRVWPFIRSVKDLDSGSWSWVADLDVDTSKLIPLEDHASVELHLNTAQDQLPEPIGVGQLQLKPSDCFLKNNTLFCCYQATQRPGVVFVVRKYASELLQDERTKFYTGFASKEDAQQDAMRKASFKRLLLNQCQEEFERNVRKSSGAAALEAAAREAKEKAKQDALDAARLALEQGVPPKEVPEELELEVWVMKLKRRMLGNIKFIGELFKQQLLKEKIMHECVKLLLGSLDTPQTVPDDESIEAAAKLFFTIGKQLESPASSKAKLDASNKLGVI